MSAPDHLGRQFDDEEPTHLSHKELRDAYSSDWPGRITEFPKHAARAWRTGDLAETRADHYDEYGGPKGWAARVGGYREDRKYDEHLPPVQVTRDGDELTVYSHHRAYDAIKRKVKRIPVEWV